MYFILIFFISHKSKKRKGENLETEKENRKEREGSLSEAGVWPHRPH